MNNKFLFLSSAWQGLSSWPITGLFRQSYKLLAGKLSPDHRIHFFFADEWIACRITDSGCICNPPWAPTWGRIIVEHNHEQHDHKHGQHHHGDCPQKSRGSRGAVQGTPTETYDLAKDKGLCELQDSLQENFNVRTEKWQHENINRQECQNRKVTMWEQKSENVRAEYWWIAYTVEPTYR